MVANLTTVLLAGFGTDRLRCDRAMKTAGREDPKNWAATLSNRAKGAEGQNRSRSIKWAAEARKTPAVGVVFFLDFPFYRTNQDFVQETAYGVQTLIYNSLQRCMNTKQAKDFMADQAAQQAAMGRTPLSDLEKRMMYFTENDPASCDDPISLNDEFEENYDTAEYEAKMFRLLSHAYKRLKDENVGGLVQWGKAISTLEQGDHYILVFLNVDSKLAPRVLRIRVVLAWGIGLGIALVIALMLGIIWNHYWNNS